MPETDDFSSAASSSSLKERMYRSRPSSLLNPANWKSMQKSPVRPRSKFIVELIKPSHYDDDGYVIQWWRGFIPSNSLSALYGLVLDARDRRVLGDNVDMEVHAYDETNRRLPIRKIIRRFHRNSNRGLAMMVGVQTNQFARAVDVARELRAAGIPVAIGGFHVSGCIA